MKIINIVGARPNFMKIAPIIKQMNKRSSIEHILVHTGQHYDTKMSDVFFQELEIPSPDIHLNIGSDTHAKQVAKIMTAFEDVCDDFQPDAILVVGDVNSTMACTLVAAKKGIKVIHVEAGIRSGDRTMPEEINRLVTDSVTDYLLPPSQDAVDNLLREGHSRDSIRLVGNVMIDNLLKLKEQIAASKILEQIGVEPQAYIALTLHRPSNVDVKEKLTGIVRSLNKLADSIKVVFPVHPRTTKMISSFGLDGLMEHKNIIKVEPLGYFDFGKLVANAKFVLTDSGGIQEETTVYGIPCITLRENTERPITVDVGTNELCPSNEEDILEMANKIMAGQWKKGSIPQYWDGETAERIVSFILEKFPN